MSALVILGNIGLFFLGLHGFWWGLMVGIFSGCATWFIPYESEPDVRPHDKELKIVYFDVDKNTITVNGRLLSENVHPSPGDSGGQCDSGSSPRIAGLLPEVSGQPKHDGVD